MEVFNGKLQSYIDSLDVKKRSKYTIKKDTYHEILKVLKSDSSNQSAKFKFWARKNFSIVQIGSQAFVHKKESNLPIIIHELIYEKILESHSAVGHSGRDKTWAEVVKILYLIFSSYKT